MIDYVEVDDRIKIPAVDLLKNDVVVHVNSFDEPSLSKFRSEFGQANESGQDIIPIIIDSYGGEVYALLAMVDLIKACEKPVATIVLGKAMSCGAILLTCGDEDLRFAAPNATIMIHDLSLMALGKIEDVKAETKEGERLNRIIFDLMDKNIGAKKNTLLNTIRKSHNGTDWFLNSKQAKKLNIVNHIRVPTLVTRVSVTTELL